MEVWINKYKTNNNFNQWEHWTKGNQLPVMSTVCEQKKRIGVFDVPVWFADIDGNGLADFLCMEPDGRTWALLNSNGGRTLTHHSQVKKTEGKDRANLNFVDVNGDGLDDLIWTNKFNGDTAVWYNKGPIPASGSSFSWENKGVVYQGAAQGLCQAFPDLDGNGRADMHVVDALTNTATTWFNDCGDAGGDDANTLTVSAVQPGPAISENVEAFMAALHEGEYQEGPIDDDKVGALAAVLSFHKCDKGEKDKIYAGWQQSWILMDYIKPKVSSIDWNSAAALEYLGPPGINRPNQERIKTILNNIVTFQEGWWWVPGWLDFKINVRCDDPADECPDPCEHPYEGNTYAYSKGLDQSTEDFYINFCPAYSSLKGVEDLMNEYKSKDDPEEKYDLENYHLSKGFTWFHELLHLGKVNKASNALEYILDYWVVIRCTDRVGNIIDKAFQAYGTLLSKSLARVGGYEGAGYTQVNDDNLALYVLAGLVQDKALNNTYPHLPLAPPPPSKVSPNPIRVGNLFEVNPNGTSTILDEAFFSVTDRCIPGLEAGEKAQMGCNNFATRDMSPAAYLAQYDSWAARK
ncbi:hypothetical protein QBC35DRAFT_463225 [Podospora australis]|uniref:VCBS repeat-containing protein n=1 Tax=Podospora australis TaxID=1536484 RepID=A0AAN7AGV6_9PEZI|nr:hypothetical protein QBC35DRAFT_463225 [Podospora australis]